MTEAYSSAARHSHIRYLNWFLAYVAFVVYGSLVPLDFHAHSVDWAWTSFQNIQILHLGIESRADWIANGVLYIPVGFLAANLLTGQNRGFGRIVMLAMSLGLACLIAVAVEFAQIFFPPRTVSLNDIVAECIGSALGILLAAHGREWFRALLGAHLQDRTQVVSLILEAYFLAFVALSLFPYDFLLSAAEVADKLASNQWGWWLADRANSHGMLWSLISPAIEAASTLPIGFFFARRAKVQSKGRSSALRLGFFLGLAIEILQFFTFTGISQGASVLTRTLGSLLGAVSWQRRASLSATRIAAFTRRLTPFLTPGYLLLLVAFNGWFSRHWHGLDAALLALGNVQFIPFYYHYYTSETMALASLVAVFAQYAPVGWVTWAHNKSPLTAALTAAGLALIVEVSRLFLDGAHPDPTSVIVAPTAAWLTVNLASMLSCVLQRDVGRATLREVPSPSDASVSQGGLEPRRASLSGPALPLRSPTWTGYSSIACAIVVVSIWLVSFPVHPMIIGLLLITYAIAIWRYPVLLMAVVPAALPVLDLAPWSGLYYFDEFDALLILGLSIAYARVTPAAQKHSSDRLLTTCLAWLALSFGISALTPLLPWVSLDANTFSSYFSQFNGLRISKGLLWALLFGYLLRRLTLHGRPATEFFASGMAVGLGLTVLVVCWEKALFDGLTNFASDYRVTGPFSIMQTGSGYVECYLTISVPFVVLRLAGSASRIIRWLCIALALATTYALMVTYARIGYAAFAVTCAIALVGTLVASRAAPRQFAKIALLGAAMLLVAIPVFKGEFAQERISQIAVDPGIRWAHWLDALSIRDESLTTAIFGMGVGRYPETHYWRSHEPYHSATYRLEHEGDKTFLRLSAGSTLYVEQLVKVRGQQQYLLSFAARSSSGGGALGLAICEKWILTSANCADWRGSALDQEPGSWQHVEKTVATHALAATPWYSRRPVKLALFNAGETTIDISNVRLIDANGEDLVGNGTYSHGLDQWFISNDNHWPWHIESIPVGILFDQGWFGLLAFAAFVALSLARAAYRAWQGSAAAATALAALTGFLLVGTVNTLIDAPRFLFLFVVLGYLCNQRQSDRRLIQQVS